jgi:hypothetical protein
VGVSILPAALLAYALVRELGDGTGHRAAGLALAGSLTTGAFVWRARRCAR